MREELNQCRSDLANDEEIFAEQQKDMEELKGVMSGEYFLMSAFSVMSGEYFLLSAFSVMSGEYFLLSAFSVMSGVLLRQHS